MMSPFAQGKYEHSAQHLYFLDSEIASELESSRPIVLIGSRGSGKTTLLRALDFRERRTNTSLRHQLGNNPFRGRFIGCYAKLSLHACSALESLYGHGTPFEGRLFGLYLDALAVHLIAGAVSEMISQGVLTAPGSLREEDVAARFNQQSADILNWLGSKQSKTLLDISDISLKVMHVLQRMADQGTKPETIAGGMRIPAFGEFSRSTLQSLLPFCNQALLDIDSSGGQANPPWHFKICLDEVESLGEGHRIVVNTLIRVAESPLFPVISYVSRPADMTTTLIPNLTLQKADFLKLQLDDATNDEFTKLAEGVASVRCRASLQDNEVSFSCEISLGKLSLNSLLDGIVRASEKQIANRIRESAEAFRLAWPEYDKGPASAPPYIESYIASQDGLNPSPAGRTKVARKQSSEQFRKKMVVAYLTLCRILGKVQVPFAYDAMVLGVSDKCIRDFLSQLHWIINEAFPLLSETDLRSFLTKPVAVAGQVSGIRRASEEKRNSISGTAGVLRPVMIGRLVSGFSRITALLQSQISKEGAALSELGIFKIEGGSEKERCDAGRLILDGAEAGFLRVVAEGVPPDPLGGFRIHRSLAPAFNLSYRGPYYTKIVRISEFNELAGCPDEEKLGHLADKIAIRLISHRDGQPLLFSMDEDEAEEVS